MCAQHSIIMEGRLRNSALTSKCEIHSFSNPKHQLLSLSSNSHHTKPPKD